MIPRLILVLIISINTFASINSVDIKRNKIKINCEHQQFKCIYQCEDEDENIQIENCYKSCDKKYLSCIKYESNVTDIEDARDRKN